MEGKANHLKKKWLMCLCVVGMTLALTACEKKEAKAPDANSSKETVTEQSPAKTDDYAGMKSDYGATEKSPATSTDVQQASPPASATAPASSADKPTETPKAPPAKQPVTSGGTSGGTAAGTSGGMAGGTAQTGSMTPPKSTPPAPTTPSTGQASETNKQNEQKQAKAYTVEIKNMAYAQPEMTVPAGSKITFINKDMMGHTATVDGGFDSGLLKQDASYTVQLDKAGEYNVYCKIHTFMKMKITVTAQ